MKNKLYRSTTQRMISGVLGGFAEYFDIDVTIIRLLFVLGVLVTGVVPLIILYIIAIIIIPESPYGGPHNVVDQQ